MDEKETLARMQAMAMIIAEHEVMLNRLIELEEVYPGIPVRWRATGKPLVNLEETLRKFSEEHG